MATHEEQTALRRTGAERLVLWLRCAAGSGSDAEAAAWARRAATALRVRGGESLVRAGHAVAMAFDALELDDIVEAVLGLVEQARQEPRGLDVSAGLAVGEIFDDDEVRFGAALDRAALLAHAVESCELAFDAEVAARAEDRYLFGRSVHRGATVGRIIDRQTPRKRNCRAALSLLGAPALPASVAANLSQLRAWALDADPAPIVLRSTQPHAALELLSLLRAELKPAFSLQLQAHAGGLQPLGALSLALASEGGSALVAAESLGALAALARGEAMPPSEAVLALRAACQTPGWIVLEQPQKLDPVTLGVVTEVSDQTSGGSRLFLLSDETSSVASGLRGRAPSRELTLEPLSFPERSEVAASVLGLPSDSSIAARLAFFGGETPGEVVQAARTLIGSGDLILRGGFFEWRREPRSAGATAVDALLAESAAGLTSAARRLLEAASVAPPGSPRSFIAAMAALDGLSAEEIADGIEQLEHEAWLSEGRFGGPLEHALRAAMRNSMPPARAAELHRFVADALYERGVGAGAPSFGHALLAHHWLEGGRDSQAPDALLDAALAATEQQLPRAAVRLASLALKLDPSEQTRARARSVARSAEASTGRTLPGTAQAPTAPPSLSPMAAPDPEPADETRVARAAIDSAITAIVRGEPEAAEATLDTAVAAGWSRAAAQRLWAVALLAKDDVPGAVHALKQARAERKPGTAHAPDAITAALILLEAGEDVDAIRAALDGLASARRDADQRGQAAALLVLSGCYRQLGREQDALRLAACADHALARL